MMHNASLITFPLFSQINVEKTPHTLQSAGLRELCVASGHQVGQRFTVADRDRLVTGVKQQAVSACWPKWKVEGLAGCPQTAEQRALSHCFCLHGGKIVAFSFFFFFALGHERRKSSAQNEETELEGKRKKKIQPVPADC